VTALNLVVNALLAVTLWASAREPIEWAACGFHSGLVLFWVLFLVASRSLVRA
jgi:hypothetical protein